MFEDIIIKKLITTLNNSYFKYTNPQKLETKATSGNYLKMYVALDTNHNLISTIHLLNIFNSLFLFLYKLVIFMGIKDPSKNYSDNIPTEIELPLLSVEVKPSIYTLEIIKV